MSDSKTYNIIVQHSLIIGNAGSVKHMSDSKTYNIIVRHSLSIGNAGSVKQMYFQLINMQHDGSKNNHLDTAATELTQTNIACVNVV